MSSSQRTQENPTQGPAQAVPGSGSARLARLVLEVVVAVLLMLLLRAFVFETFYVPSGSMEPTVQPGDRVVVDKVHGGRDLRRGDIIVFDGTTVFGGPSLAPHESSGLIGSVLARTASGLGLDLGEKDYLKRVVGLPGDHVVCCTAAGELTVNGVAVHEPYVVAGAKASELTFDVVVPAGKLWVMGDNRPESADSRAHLGDPGGGMVPVSDVVGRAALRFWPLARWGTIDRAGMPDVPAPTPARGP